MTIRYPRALRPGDTIGVTAPSAGVAEPLRPRLDFCVDWFRGRGFRVVVGDCIDGSGHVSAPVADRAAELTALFADPTIRAIVPPWGGETGIDLVDLLDYDAIAAAEPTWAVGFSDTSTWLLPLTLRTGIATAHGQNLMDTPYGLPEGFLPWSRLPGAGGRIEQRASTHHRAPGWDDWAVDPTPTAMPLTQPGGWRVLCGPDRGQLSGRLIGGCIETVSLLAGTAYGDVRAFGSQQDEGLLLYLEASELGAFDIARMLHAMRLAGWFEHANGVLLGRTRAPTSGEFTQDDAARDALGRLGIPVLADLDFGHVPPCHVFVNGAVAQVSIDDDRQEIVQTLA